MKQTEISLPKDAVLPHHVAIIPDGNRRWARARGLHPVEGHKKGAQTLRDLVKSNQKLGITTLTFWGFSTENWGRDNAEVKTLLKVIEHALANYGQEAREKGMRFVHIGRKDRLPASLLVKIQNLEEKTRKNHNFIFNLALDYGGHDEITRAVKKIVAGGLRPEEIDEKVIERYLDTGGQPYPYVDLLIRTSGEQRLSGILSWQMEYAEVWWEETPFPDFTPERFKEVLLDYSRRRRRFGADDKVKKLFAFSPRVVARLELDWWRLRRFSDRGGFAKAFAHYIKEQFGISTVLAKEAAELFAKAAIGEHDQERAHQLMTKFYGFIRDNVKLAFEPKLVASLELEYLKKSNGEKKLMELEETASKLYAETFRIPLLQAHKVVRLRLLAHDQEELAQEATGERKKQLLGQAKQYLIQSYEVLKERVA